MKNFKFIKLANWLSERKLMLFIVAVSIVAIALPGAIVFATENATDEAQQPATPTTEEAAVPASPATEEEATPATEAEVAEEAADEGVVIVTGDDTEEVTETETITEEVNATVTVSGTLEDSSEKAIPETEEPYVMIAGYYMQSLIIPVVYQDRIYLKGGVKQFSFENVPSNLTGVITAGAKGYANEILSINSDTISTAKNFKLNSGSSCTFVNDEDKLGQYTLCEGSKFKSKDGATDLTLSFDVGLGAGLPVFGLEAGATFKEVTSDLGYNYLVYDYKNTTTSEEIHLIFAVSAESGYEFNYWELNDNLIKDTYTVKADEPITINPVFTEAGKMIVGGVVKDKASQQPINGAFGYVLGYNTSTSEVYVSKPKATGADGIFEFDDVPDGLMGVLIVGAEGHTSQMQYLSYYVPRTEFELNPGVLCKIDETDNFGGIVVKAGSSIKFSGVEEPLSLPIDLDLGKDFPALGFPTDDSSTLNFDAKGNVNYKFNHDPATHNIEKMNLNLRVYGSEGYAFKNWLKDGLEFSGELKLSEQTKDFTIKPCFRLAGPYTFSTYIQNEQKERITNGYAYLIGFHESTYEPYLSDVAKTDSQGVFTIANIPYDVFGLMVVGAPGYVNRFEYIDCDTEATFYTLEPGVEIAFDMPETASTVILEKGSSVDVVIDGIPFSTLTLPEDIDFGDYFLPFSMTTEGTFNFMDDGRLNYSFSKSSNAAYIQIISLSATFRVVPKDGYVFKNWTKDGEVISGEYKLQEGDKDFVIAPVFVQVTPPSPDTPVINPTGLAKTFDSIGDLYQALAILLAAFAVVYTLRRVMNH